jgi:hypothetical protein
VRPSAAWLVAAKLTHAAAAVDVDDIEGLFRFVATSCATPFECPIVLQHQVCGDAPMVAEYDGDAGLTRAHLRQLYSMNPNRTTVDQEVARLRERNKLYAVGLGATRDDTIGLCLQDDFVRILRSLKSPLVGRFLEHLLSTRSSEHIFPRAALHAAKFTDVEITCVGR